MRAVVQRTSGGSVEAAGKRLGGVKTGLIVFLGIKKGDGTAEAAYILDKIAGLRIFPDEEGKMNRSLLDIKGEILLISQFTLYGDARKGRRPGFIDAEIPDKAEPLFNWALEYIKNLGIKAETGAFGAEMRVNIINDGPCTILLDSEKMF